MEKQINTASVRLSINQDINRAIATINDLCQSYEAQIQQLQAQIAELEKDKK